MVRLLAERSDTKSNVKLGGFRSQLQASDVSSHNEELWYNETVCLWMTIYIYIYIYILSSVLEWWIYINNKDKRILPSSIKLPNDTIWYAYLINTREVLV